MRLVLVLIACSTPESEPSLPLGGRGLSGYHVLAGADSAVPQGQIGFFLTADGRGGYVLSWTGDASGSSFAGTATTDVGFDPSGTQAVTGTEQVLFSAVNRIDFSGVPGTTVEGVRLVTQSDPIYLDVTVAGSHQGFGIFFTGASTRLVQESSFDPVAFASP